MDLAYRESKDRKESIKREIEELLYKSIIFVSKDDMDKFEIKKVGPAIRKLFDRLISKNVIRNKPAIIRDKLKDKIIRDISRRFETKKKKERTRSIMVKQIRI